MDYEMSEKSLVHYLPSAIFFLSNVLIPLFYFFSSESFMGCFVYFEAFSIVHNKLQMKKTMSLPLIPKYFKIGNKFYLYVSYT